MDFHYIITLTKAADSGMRFATVKGVIKPLASQTRNDLANAVYKYASSKADMPDATIAFFDLAPNELPAVVQAVCY